MFSGWETYYQMTGEAAATLTGLLFIVASLSAGRPSSGLSQGLRLFTTPTVFHLASVLVVSALAIAPRAEGWSPCAIMTGWTAISLVYVVATAVGLHRVENPTHWTDFWFYGVGPLVIYLGLVGSSAAAWARVGHAAYLVALCLLALLALTIRNAWDLVTWLAPRRGDAPE
jgi:hypothetical protein